MTYLARHTLSLNLTTLPYDTLTLVLKKKGMKFCFFQTLREALSSKSNFQKHYFELAELAIGTFKHMKHYRAARSIGSSLAEFYM